MTLITFYVLYVDDFRILVLPKSLDDVFMALNVFSLFVFMSEVILSSFALKGYFRFYFWLDLIATISLVSDITWIWYPIVGIREDVNVFNKEGVFDPREVEASAS